VKRRRPVLLLLTVAVCLACSRSENRVSAPSIADENTPQDGGTVVRRIESDIVGVNPVLEKSRYDRDVNIYLFTPMVQLDTNLRPAPGLAERWEISPDGKQYTFHLAPKATFSDGTPVLASDVLFTLKKIIDPEMEAAQVAPGFQLADIPNCKVIDPHTVMIAFKEPDASQIIHFNDLLALPEHVYAKGNFKNDYMNTAVGSGPYRLVRRVPGKEVLLERREDYWGVKPHLKNVLFKVVVDGQTAWNAVKHGDVDETAIGSDVWLMESKRPELQRMIDFRRFYTLSYNYIAWNEHDPLFADKRVRRALGMCLDVGSIINNLYHGTARALSGPFTPDQFGFNPNVPVLPFDPLGARRLLNDAGWFDTNHDGVLDKDGKPFKFDFYIFAGSVAALPVAQLFQEELKKAGVEMNVVQIDPALMIQRMIAGNYQAGYLAWDLDPDPDPFPQFHSSQIPPKGQNFVYYVNPVADKLIEDARRELDFNKRVKMYQQLHEMLAADQPYTWVIQVSVKWAVNKRIKNVKESHGWGLFTWYPGEMDWWIPRDQRTHDFVAATTTATTTH
jgi:peptide/nickel transport system substrate-binding protein